MTDPYLRSLSLHAAHRGKLGIAAKVPLETQDDLTLAYTPGVARPCEVIAEDPQQARQLTVKGNSVAVVTDGSAVLGLEGLCRRARSGPLPFPCRLGLDPVVRVEAFVLGGRIYLLQDLSLEADRAGAASVDVWARSVIRLLEYDGETPSFELAP